MPLLRYDPASRDLSDLLAFQDGAVSRQQIVALGYSEGWIRARVRSGRWQRWSPGVYLATAGRPSYRAVVWAAVLHAGTGAHASHQTAAFLAGLFDQWSNPVHVTIPAGRKVRGRSGLAAHRARPTLPRPVVGQPPRSRNEDLVLDLAQTAADDLGTVGIVTAAFQRRLTTPRLLRLALELRPRVRRRALIIRLLDDDAGGVHSPLEWLYLTAVERAHRLPTARRQAAVIFRGRKEYRDVWYEEYRVVVELDGRRWHEREVFRDMARDNRASQRGETTLRYGYQDVVGRPCAVARQVAAVLSRGGWSGSGHRCSPACRVGRDLPGVPRRS